jgi:hypothetical protein
MAKRCLRVVGQGNNKREHDPVKDPIKDNVTLERPSPERLRFSRFSSAEFPEAARVPPPAQFSPPRTADGKPNFNGLWQVLNTANWNIQDHSRARASCRARALSRA